MQKRVCFILGLFFLIFILLHSDTRNIRLKETYSPSVIETEGTGGLNPANTAPVKIRTGSQADKSQPTASSTQKTTTTSADFPALRDEVISLCNKHHVVGMSLAVFRNEEIIYTQSYGYSDKEQKIKANQNTKYRAASISKTISGMIAMDLAEKGKLDIHRDISEYIGLKIRSPYYPDVPITTWHLLTHTSGIIDSSPYFKKATDQKPFITLKTILDNGGVFHKGRPGSRYVYSNFGMGLLAGVIEGATGERFYDYAQNALFEPMNMDAGYLRSQIRDTRNLASIYSGRYGTVNLKTWNRVESSYEHFPIGQMYLLAHGDLIISAVDLARLAMLLCNDGSYQGKRYIEKGAIEKINTPAASRGGSDVGLALMMSTGLVRGRKLHGHSGQAYGMVAGMYYDRSDKTGVVFISNGCDRNKNSAGEYMVNHDIINLAYSKIIK